MTDTTKTRQSEQLFLVRHYGEIDYATAIATPTINLRESRVEVPAHAVEVVAGPFPIRTESSDDPNYPKMNRSVITTPKGEVAWSNAASAYVLPSGERMTCLSAAIATTIGA
jgi:hypothetical protein